MEGYRVLLLVVIRVILLMIGVSLLCIQVTPRVSRLSLAVPARWCLKDAVGPPRPGPGRRKA